jgi:type III secretory pathway component EscR
MLISFWLTVFVLASGWILEIKKLCIKYELGDSIHYVQNHLSKAKWKSLIISAIYKYWSDRINEEIKYYSTLILKSVIRFLLPGYTVGRLDQ